MSYGKPNSSYSLGLDKRFLINMKLGDDTVRSDDLAYCLKEVGYGLFSDSEHFPSPEEIVQEIRKNGTQNSSTVEFIEKTVNTLMFGCCAVKRAEFSDECETRMIFQTRKYDQPYKKTKFRNIGGIIPPYISVPIPLTAIKEIIIGSHVTKDLAAKGLHAIIKKHKIECKVSHSNCSLRQY